MSLTSALNTAQSIFNNTGTQSSTVSNNIANASNANYSRRQASISTSLSGATVVQISRAQETALQSQYLTSNSQDSAQQRLLQGLSDIQATIGGNDSELSPASYLAAFQTALQAYAVSPSSTTAAQSAISAAQDVTNSLNTATASVQSIRGSADQEITKDVASLNDLLGQFKAANDAAKSAKDGTAQQADAMDTRDGVLQKISSLIGIKTVTRAGNDVAIYTSDGTPLFDGVARKVTFQPTSTYSATTVGKSIMIDGTPLKAGSGSATTGQGSLQALLQVRDEIAPTYQGQLDQVAQGLVTAFSENDSSGSSVPGLFTWTPPAPATAYTPGTSSIVSGIAATISVSASVITSQGGDPSKLRDGTVNSASVGVNTSASASYSTLLDSYVSGLDADRTFDPTTGVATTSSLMEYASNSIGWLESYRSGASTAAENTSAASSRSSEAYTNETGVNLDEELSLMMDIEQSYKAGTKILNAVDEMLQSLLQAAS